MYQENKMPNKDKENCTYQYDYKEKCDCSEDDKCGCSYPNNMSHDVKCVCTPDDEDESTLNCECDDKSEYTMHKLNKGKKQK